MVRSPLAIGFGLFCACACAFATASQDDCWFPFCFKVFSKRFDVRLNFFSSFFRSSDPIPIEEYIRQHGYPVEQHSISTQDGYELLYHRIPHGRRGGGGRRGGPVLVQHGLLGSSSVWVLDPSSLAYVLADAGFDVWLGNARGSTYSRKHIKYDPDKDKKKFWDFTWHEMGYYDLPASIDYILNVTGNTQLSYIGHSMGTTMYFVLGATRPEYMDKVKAMVALAPVVFLWNIQSPLAKLFFDTQSVFSMYVKLFGLYELFPYSPSMLWIDENICARPQLQFICREIMNALGGYDDREINRTALTTILQYVPAGTSYKVFEHFKQMSKQGNNFHQFDYGYIRNYIKYGSIHPPAYNLTNIKAPTYIYFAKNDYLADPKDVNYTIEHLPNVVKVTEVPLEMFNHLDFMWAVEAKTLLYDDIVFTLNNLTHSQARQERKVKNSLSSPISKKEYDVYLVN